MKRWNIGLKAATQTIQVTTQRGIRTILHPTLARRFRTNDRQLRYRRLPCEMFTDTLEASVVSWQRQNHYAQVFTTRFGWTRIFPIRKQSDTYVWVITIGSKGWCSPESHYGWLKGADDDRMQLKVLSESSRKVLEGRWPRCRPQPSCGIIVWSWKLI